MIKDFLQFIKEKMFTKTKAKEDLFARLFVFIEDSLVPLTREKSLEKTLYLEETNFVYHEDKTSFNPYKRLEKISKKYKLNYFEQKQIITLIDTLKDKRLYAASLEEINPINNIYEIDWKNTSKENLSLVFKNKAILTNNLDAKQQQNFAQYCEDIIFFKKKLPLGVESVLFDNKDKYAFFDILGIEYLNNENLKFIQNLITKNQAPQSFQEKRIKMAILQIKNICSLLDLQTAWQFGLNINFSQKLSHQESLEHLQKQTLFLPKPQKINFIPAKEIYFSLLKKRKQEQKRYKKSSILFWGPLLILFYLLLYYH